MTKQIDKSNNINYHHQIIECQPKGTYLIKFQPKDAESYKS